MNPTTEISRTALFRRGFALEYTTLGWNVVGIVVLTVAAISARSVALAALDNPVLKTEGRITFIDGLLATAVLLGLVLNTVGLWWADPLAGYVLVYYAARETRDIFTSTH